MEDQIRYCHTVLNEELYRSKFHNHKGIGNIKYMLSKVYNKMSFMR